MVATSWRALALGRRGGPHLIRLGGVGSLMGALPETRKRVLRRPGLASSPGVGARKGAEVPVGARQAAAAASEGAQENGNIATSITSGAKEEGAGPPREGEGRRQDSEGVKARTQEVIKFLGYSHE